MKFTQNPFFAGNFFVVNGPDYTDHDVGGYVIDMQSAKVVSKFDINGPEQGLSNPHDLSVTNDATEIFVAELDPKRLVKFVYTNGTNKVIRKKESTDNVSGKI